MNPIRIVVKPSRRWFQGRGQWKWGIVAANGEPLDPRDTVPNTGDIENAMRSLVAGSVPVVLEVHYRDGSVQETKLR